MCFSQMLGNRLVNWLETLFLVNIETSLWIILDKRDHIKISFWNQHEGGQRNILPKRLEGIILLTKDWELNEIKNKLDGVNSKLKISGKKSEPKDIAIEAFYNKTKDKLKF